MPIEPIEQINKYPTLDNNREDKIQQKPLVLAGYGCILRQTTKLPPTSENKDKPLPLYYNNQNQRMNKSDNETVITKYSAQIVQTFDNHHTKRKTVLVTIKVKLCEYYKNDTDYINEGIELMVDLLHKWKDNHYINKIIRLDNEIIHDYFEDITEWIHDPRVFGGKEKKI